MDNKFWRRYEKCKDYVDSKDLLNRSNKCWNFFSGKQWEGLESDGEVLPMFNIIYPNIKRKVTTIYTNRMSVNYSDLDGREELQPVYERLTQMFSAKWEKANEDVLCRKALKHGGITGDGLQFFPTGNVEDVQMLLNTDILYGDESEPNIQRQPFVIIQERRSVEEVKEMARKNGVPEEEVALIRPDRDTDHTLGNIDEVENADSSDTMKVTIITHFEKKKEPVTMMMWNDTEEGRVGTEIETGMTRDVVYVAKCTKDVMVEPERSVRGEPSPVEKANGRKGRALSLYPIVKFSWEEYPNDARGVSQVEGLIPNQILINKTLARRDMCTQMTAYPRMAYDSNFIANPDDLMKVGMPIEVTSGGVNSVNQAVSYLNPAASSDEPKRLTDDLLEITQEISGSGDTTMGNIDLQRVAASAIVAVNDQAQSMHDDTVANFQLFVEDMANLWVELWQVFEPNGMDVMMKRQVEAPVTDPITGEPVVDQMTGQPQTEIKEIEVMEHITSEELDMIKPRTRIDVTKDTAFKSEAVQQENDKLLESGIITFEEWVEVSEAGTIPKAAYESIVEKRKAMQAQMPQMEQPVEQAPQGAM